MSSKGPHIVECLVTRAWNSLIEWNSLTGLEGLGSMALLEEVCHWSQAVRSQTLVYSPFAYRSKCSLQLLLPHLPDAAMLTALMIMV